MAVASSAQTVSKSSTVTVILCFAAAVAEGFDIQAIGIAAPRLAPELGLGPDALGWTFAIGNVGLVIGATMGGWLADRIGRKPVFVSAVFLFGLFTLLTAWASTFSSLFVVRFCAGLNFGAALPIMMAVATEVSTPRKRAQTAAAVFCGMPLGGGLAALLAQSGGGDMDWRMLFYVGGILPMILACLLYTSMQETLQPGAAAGVEVKRQSVWETLFGGGRASPTLLLWIIFFPTLLILYLILNWLPTLVVAKGMDAVIAPRASLAFNFASVAGALLIGRLVDRFDARWPLTIAYLALAVALLGLSRADTMIEIIVLSGLAGFFVLGANYALYGVAPAFYSPQTRGTGAGASIAAGRVGSIVGPLLAGLLLGGGLSAGGVVTYLIPMALLAAVAVFALSFRRRPY